MFEGRYKSCLVKEDSYFLQTSRYIHLNPVKAGMVKYPEEYRWSSYRTMIGLSDDKITMVSKTLAYFKNNSVMRYRKFVADTGHKSLAWSSVLLALGNRKEKVVDRPKALGDIRGVTYIFGMFYRFGLIDVPDEVQEKMKHPKQKTDKQ